MPKKYLLIRYSSLGDVILTTSVVENIASYDPEAQIDFLTKEKYFPVYEHNRNINKLYSHIKMGSQYDVIIDLHDSIRSNISRLFAYSKQRVTYNKAMLSRRLFLHSGIKEEDLAKSVRERYLETLEKVGVETGDFKPRLYISNDEIEHAKEITEHKNYIAVVPGAKWKTKQWIEENYLSFIIKVIKEFRMDVVVLGDMHDKELADEILMGVGLLKKHVVNLVGNTNLREFFSVLNNAKAILTVDSSAMHVGCALGINTVALFGPTVKEFGFQPAADNVKILERDLECRPCSLHGSKKCKYFDRACMMRIEVNEVLDEFRELLGFEKKIFS